MMLYRDMSARSLKRICKDRGLTQSGAKSELIVRLEDQDKEKLKRKLPGNDKEEQDKTERTSKKARIKGEVSAYDQRNVKQLKDLCFSRRISKKAKDKAALVARLQANDRGEDEPGEECPICGNICAFEFFDGSSQSLEHASAGHGRGKKCRWCSRDHIMSRLSDGIPPAEIECIWCTKPLTQAEVRRQLSDDKPDYQVYLSTESWHAHWEHPNFHQCQESGCSEGGTIEAGDIDSHCARFNCRLDGTGHENCLVCKTVHKPDETCEKYRASNPISYPIDEASRFLRNYIAKPCPRCGIYISKTDCHQVRCVAEVRPKVKCGHVFCYDCGKHRNGDDGYHKTWHEDGCPHDGPGTKSAKNKSKIILGLDD